jgi:hypothetical protein
MYRWTQDYWRCWWFNFDTYEWHFDSGMLALVEPGGRGSWSSLVFALGACGSALVVRGYQLSGAARACVAAKWSSLRKRLGAWLLGDEHIECSLNPGAVEFVPSIASIPSSLLGTSGEGGAKPDDVADPGPPPGLCGDSTRLRLPVEYAPLASGTPAFGTLADAGAETDAESVAEWDGVSTVSAEHLPGIRAMKQRLAVAILEARKAAGPPGCYGCKVVLPRSIFRKLLDEAQLSATQAQKLIGLRPFRGKFELQDEGLLCHADFDEE